MPVMGASSSPPSHTLKRIVRRSAKSPPVPSCPLGFGHRTIQRSCTAWGPPALQAFRPSELGSVQTGGGNQIDRFQEGPHGAPPCGPFYSQWWPASFASAVWATSPPNRNHITIRFRSHKRPVAACQQPALSQVAPVTFRTDVALAGVEHHPTQGHRRTFGPSRAGSAVLVRRLHDLPHRRMHLTFSME